MAEFMVGAVVIGFVFAVVLPALILWVVTRFMLGVLWLGYTVLGDREGMRSAFPRYYAWTEKGER